jgi:hypothetical protein
MMPKAARSRRSLGNGFAACVRFLGAGVFVIAPALGSAILFLLREATSGQLLHTGQLPHEQRDAPDWNRTSARGLGTLGRSCVK